MARSAPGVGGHDVGSLDRLLRTMRMKDLARSSLLLQSQSRPLHHFRIQLVPLWRSDLKVDPQPRVGDDHLVKDVVRVADPGDRKTGKGGERVGEGSADFEEGLNVGEDLGGVVEVREGVDDGDRGVGSERLEERRG